MKTVTINEITYTIDRTGYGNYNVTRHSDGVKLHTTDSQMFDWIEDDSDEAQQRIAERALMRLFREYDE